MTEQYIYSRSEREFVNTLNQTIPLGFGFMALSSGMDNALKRDVAVHCEDCPRLSQTDSQGIPLPLFRKTHLPKGQMLLQKSAWIEKGSRDFHVAHGYVLDEEAVRSTGPAKWLSAAFRLEDPNAVPGGIPPLESRLELSEPKHQDFRCLKDSALGLDSEPFCQMLLACVDALASRQQVLIAWDFEQPEEQNLRRSVLFWIYTCLPYDLWPRLGFDSVYTDKSSPGLVQLAFVDKRSIREEGQAPSIQLGNQLVPLGGNFLIQDGEIIHNDSKYQTEWYQKDISYAKWLGRLVNTVWKCPRDKEKAVLLALEDVRWSFQRKLSSVPEEKRLNPEEYRRACEAIYNLRNLEEAAGLEKPKPPAVKRTEPPKKQEPSPAEVYHRIFQRCKEPPSPTDLKDLAGIRGEIEPYAIGLLSAFMAREADAPGAMLSAVLRRYQELLPPDVYAQLPGYLFWDGVDVENQYVWDSCGVEKGVDAANRRRYSWYAEIVSAYNTTVDLTTYLSSSFRDGLPGVSGEQCASMESEWFQWVLEGILARRTIPANQRDIQLLAAMCSGRAGDIAMGFLGAFLAQAADTPQMKLWEVLNSYQWLLQPYGIYPQLLRCLFWNELTNAERSAWNKCGVENSKDAANRRRLKWYQEIAQSYSPPEDERAFARRWLDQLPGISGPFRANMEEELCVIIQIRKKNNES